MSPRNFSGGFSLKSKLLLLVAVVCFCFAIIMTLAIVSLYQVKDLSSGVVETQMSGLIENSQITREVSVVFSKIHLLGFQLHGENPYVEAVEDDIQHRLDELNVKIKNPDIHQSLIQLKTSLAETLAQYRKILALFLDTELFEREVSGTLEQFEFDISEWEFRLAADGQENIQIPQLYSLIDSFRADLQKISEKNAGHRFALYSSNYRYHEASSVTLIAALRQRLDELPTDIQLVATYHQRLGDRLLAFENGSDELYQQLAQFSFGLLKLATLEDRTLKLVNESDQTVNRHAETLIKQLDSIISSSGLTIFLLSLLVMVTMAVTVLLMIRISINKPIARIVEGVEAFRQGNLVSRITLNSGDELATIGNALNAMAGELHESYSELKDSEDKFYQVFENEINALLIFDQASGCCLDANRVALELYGVGLDEIKQLHIDELEQQIDNSHLDTKTDRWIQGFHRRQDGSQFPVEVHTGSFVRQGRRFIFKSVRDLTEQQRLQSQQQRTMALLETTLESTSEGVVALTNKGEITNYNKKFIELFGVNKEALDSGHIRYILPSIVRHLKDRADFLSMVRTAHEGLDTIASDVLELVDGRMFECHSHPQLLNGQAVGRVWNFRDVSEYFEIMHELREKESRLVHIAHHDALTGLSNRLLFVDRLQQAIRQAKRSKDRLAVFFIDLDRFKSINDSLGHQVGDTLLKHFSERLKSVVRQTDTIARLGGDEFTVILESVEGPEDVAMVAQKILDTLKQPFTAEEHQFYVTSSIGISLYPDDGNSADILLKNADAAMYKSKDEGRNTYHFYTEDMTSQAYERVLMEARLREALEFDQFEIYYQPQYDLVNGELVGAEALIRWHHPEEGLLAPCDFLPTAEETGLIVEIDQWVFQRVCQQVADWVQKGMILDGLRIAVNLSGRQLKHETLPETFAKILQETRCPSEYLELEISEGFIMHQPDVSTHIMGRLKDLGLQLSIDDFGTGYSSLAYLKRLPINKLKIDRSFVQDVVDDPNDAAISKSVIALGHSMNLQVVAEGIENVEQQSFLQGEGCDMGQGYLYSRPIVAKELESHLKMSTVEQVI